MVKLFDCDGSDACSCVCVYMKRLLTGVCTTKHIYSKLLAKMHAYCKQRCLICRISLLFVCDCVVRCEISMLIPVFFYFFDNGTFISSANIELKRIKEKKPLAATQTPESLESAKINWCAVFPCFSECCAKEDAF